MKTAVLIFAALCLCGCATPSPRKVRQIAVPLPGGGQRLIQTAPLPEPSFKASAARLVIIPWRYGLPQGTLPNHYWWNVEHSLNGKQWSVLYSNVSEIPIIETTNKLEYFRLVGRL